MVQKIKRSGAEAVIFGGYHPEASKIITQMRKKRLDTIFISDDGVKDDTFIKVAGKYAEGVDATGPRTAPPIRSPKKASKHKAKFGSIPVPLRERLLCCARALNAADKADSTDMEAVRNALQNNDNGNPSWTHPL